MSLSFARTLDRKRPRIGLCLLTAVHIAALSASARATPSLLQTRADAQKQATEDPTITVTGMSERQQLKVIRNYIDGLTVSVSYNPLARYDAKSYCPAVLGLTPARNNEIATRMSAVAEAAGVRPAAVGCRTSALVFFVDDKESFLTLFRKQHPLYFSDLRRQYQSLPPKEEGPVSAWQLVAKRDPQGAIIAKPSNLGPTVVASSMRGSRILSMVSQVVVMSVVIIERRSLVGLTTTQIADYAAMRTLSDRGLKPNGVPDQFTILEALTAPMGSAVPHSLTKWDLAYLEGRYASNAAEYGLSQRATIQRSLRRAAKRSEPD